MLLPTSFARDSGLCWQMHGLEAALFWLLLSACSLLCDLRELSFFFLPL